MSAELVSLRHGRNRIEFAREPRAVDTSEWLHEILGKIYEAPGAPHPWKAVLDRLKTRFDAAHAVFMLQAPTTDQCGIFINSGIEDERARSCYEHQYFTADPFIGLTDGDVVTADDLLGSRWLLSRIYQDYLRPLDIRHLLAADVCIPGGVHCSLRLTRSHRGRPFDSEDKALIYSLLPHIRRSVGLWSRIENLQSDREVYAGTVESLSLGFIALGEDGVIIHANQEARRILDQRDGIFVRRGNLELDAADEKSELQRLLHDACHKPAPARGKAKLAGGMAITRPSGRASIAVMVKPALRNLETKLPHPPQVVLYLRDPSAELPQPTEELIRRVFGLTRVEARLVLRLTEGLSLDETSEAMAIRLNTARTHLRSIFSKTGVSRQGLLVRLVLKSLMTLG